MTQRQAREPQEGVYRIPPLQPDLFTSVEGGRFLEDNMQAKATHLNREQRFDILMKAMAKKPNLKQRILRILEYMGGDDEAFAVTLDTIAYSRRRDKDPSGYSGLGYTLNALDGCIEDGLLPVAKMKSLLEVGIVFDSLIHNRLW